MDDQNNRDNEMSKIVEKAENLKTMLAKQKNGEAEAPAEPEEKAPEAPVGNPDLRPLRTKSRLLKRRSAPKPMRRSPTRSAHRLTRNRPSKTRRPRRKRLPKTSRRSSPRRTASSPTLNGKKRKLRRRSKPRKRKRKRCAARSKKPARTRRITTMSSHSSDGPSPNATPKWPTSPLNGTTP